MKDLGKIEKFDKFNIVKKSFLKFQITFTNVVILSFHLLI
ncbi:hypothetical protein LEP1GSC170_1066 [Leptospira interrogans serovar Bataviae str. HAI135]|nr:hypothetical protein LEP1GSC170_1066 [Leptospira interrogans serovar Bataviae str. HAI135]